MVKICYTPFQSFAFVHISVNVGSHKPGNPLRLFCLVLTQFMFNMYIHTYIHKENMT